MSATDLTDSSIAPHQGLDPVSDSTALKQAYSCFPSGVVAVCSHHQRDGSAESELIGMAASAFTSVSLDPPLVSVCVQNTSTTWPRLRAAQALGVSVFADHQSQICRQLAGPAQSRFDGVNPTGTPDGALFVPGAAAHLSCSIAREVAAGDHILVLLRIESLASDPSVEPLVFHASTFRALQARAADDSQPPTPDQSAPR